MESTEIKEYLTELKSITRSRNKRVLRNTINRWETRLQNERLLQ